MQRPAAILFDVGDTLLVEHRFDLDAGIRAAVPHMEAQIPEFAQSFRDSLRAQHRDDREPLLARWLAERVTSLAGRATEDIEDAIWPAVVTLDVMPGVGPVLAQLRAAGVVLGAVSNAYFSGRVLGRELERHGLGEHIAFVLSSADLGMRKPARAIFEAALRRAGRSARATWFVGDTYAEDVVGAARAGLTPVWLSNHIPAAGGAEACRVSSWSEFGALCAASLST